MRHIRTGRSRLSMISVTADRKSGVTSIKFKRPLQTNEPVNDRAIPTDREVSVIAAIGPLNSRREANAHSHNGMDVNSDDIQINFSSRVSCGVHIHTRFELKLGIFFYYSADGSRMPIITLQPQRRKCPKAMANSQGIWREWNNRPNRSNRRATRLHTNHRCSLLGHRLVSKRPTDSRIVCGAWRDVHFHHRRWWQIQSAGQIPSLLHNRFARGRCRPSIGQWET